MTGIACTFDGWLTRDPNPLRFTSRGDAMVGFSVAVQGTKAPAGGAQRAWVTIFGERAEELDGVLKEAAMVRVQGRLCLRSWESSEGERQFGLAITADAVELLDETSQPPSRSPRAPRRERRRRRDDQVTEQQHPTPETVAARPERDLRRELGLDDGDSLTDDVPF